MKPNARVHPAWIAIPAASSFTCRAAWMAAVVMITLSSADGWSPARAEGPAPTTKGEEVSTVGSGPYAGPMPEELTKLAELAAAIPAPSPPKKEPSADTITGGGGHTLTDAERAKAAALPVIPSSLPDWLMLKLTPMVVSKDGVPQLTAPERAKRAVELSAPPTAAGSRR